MRTSRALVAGVAGVMAAVVTIAGTVQSAVVDRPDAHRVDVRGRVVWSEPVRTLSAAQARTALRRSGYDARDVTHAIGLWRVVYRTVGPDQRGTTASGLLAVPVTPTRTLTTVLFEHGTVSYRADAPSALPADLFASAPALAYAAAGYATVAPDYLGLGLGPGAHPWFDVASETTASVDLLRAARAVVGAGPHRLGRAVLVTGFSQGASAALGVGRALQREHGYFRVAALAPVSGAYAFTRVELPALLDGRIAEQVAVPYTAYLLTAWQRLHHLYDPERTVVRAPYAARLGTLFGGAVPGPDLRRGLPPTLRALLTGPGRALLAHPTGRFARALRVADDVCRWRPAVPVRLYRATADEQALTANTTACARSLLAHRAAVRTVGLGTALYAGSRHLGSGVAAVPATLRWFVRVARPAAEAVR